MKIIKKLFLLIFVLSARIFSQTTPFVENGKLDLSGWNIDRDGIIRIEDRSGENLKPSFYDKENDTAAFDITIILPQNNNKSAEQRAFAFMLEPVVSPYNLWINENIALSNNFNYFSHWRIKYNIRSVILPLYLTYSNNIRIHLVINDYSKIKLIRDNLLIGLERVIRKFRWWSFFREGITEGALILIFLISLLLWRGKAGNTAFLILGLFSLIQALNLIGRGESLNFIPDISSSSLVSIQMTLIFIGLSLLMAFFMILFNSLPGRISVAAMSALTVIMSLMLFVLPVSQKAVVEYGLLVYHSVLLITLLSYILLSFFYLKREKIKSLTVIITSAVFLVSYLIYFIQYKIYIISSSVIVNGQQDTLGYGMVFFVLINFLYIHVRSSRKAENNEETLPEDIARKFLLSKREFEILKLLVKRYSYKEIASRLFISNKTVETHAYHIYQKTGAGSKQELIDLIGSLQ